MGFTFDLTNMPSNEERMAESLAKIKDGLKGIDNPDVRSRKEESPGQLMLIEQCVSADPTWDMALAVEIAFELGRYAAGEKVSATEKQRVAGLATAARNKAKADAWQGPAKQIWWEARRPTPHGR